MLDALAAVMVPSLLNAGRSFSNLLGSPRPGSSSSLTRIASPFFWAIETGAISLAKAPLFCASLASA